jgi:hypothetical protein
MKTVSPTASGAAPNRLRQTLCRADVQRNLRTAAVLGIAASGGLIGTGWLAATACTTFMGLMTVRLLQLGNESRALQAGTVIPKASMGDPFR